MAHSAAGDAGDIVGRTEEAHGARVALHSAMHGSATVVTVIGPTTAGGGRFVRWLARQRPPHAQLEWLDGSTASVTDLSAIEARIRGRPGLLMVVVIDGLERLPQDERDAVVHLLDAIDDHPEASVACILVVGAEHQLPERARRDSVHAIRLGPLGDTSVHELLSRLVGGQVDLAFNDLVVRLTKGQPELIRRLVDQAFEQQWLERGPSGWRARVGAAALLPATGGLAALSNPGLDDELASTAACIGQDGPLEVLRSVLKVASEEFDARIERPAMSQVLDDDGIRFWFRDPSVREAIYWRTPIRRRQRLHADVAAALASTVREPTRADDDASLLHWELAGPRADSALRTPALLAIADRAERAGRWHAVARALEGVLDDRSLDAPTRVRMLLRAAEASFRHQSPHRAVELFNEAADLASTTGDEHSQRRATARGLAICVAHGIAFDDSGDETQDEVDAWRELARADVHFAAGDAEAGLAACRRADDLAVAWNEPEVAARAAMAEGQHQLLALRLGAARTAYSRGAVRTRVSADPLHQLWARSRLALTAWVSGEVDDARHIATAAARDAERGRWWGEASLAHAVAAVTAVSCGAMSEALAAARRALALAHRSSYHFGLPLALPAIAAVAATSADEVLLDEASTAWVTTGHMPSLVTALARTMLGRFDVGAVSARPFGAPDLFRAGAAVAAAELGDWADDPDLAAAQLPLLRDLVDRGVVHVPGWSTSVPRAAALAAHASGNDELASSLAQFARDEAERGGAHLDAALARYDLARWQPSEDIRPLAQSVSELEALGCSSYVIRAQHQLDGHPGARAVAWEHPRRVLLYTDLVGSTAVNQRTGDERFVGLLARHQAAVDHAATTHRGVRFHNTGDGFGIWFVSAADALACADAIRLGLERDAPDRPDVRLAVRIGLAAGRPVPFEGDLYGLAVVRAARVCALAGAGEVLVSKEVLDFEPLSDVTVTFVVDAPLKGFDDTTPLYRLHRRDHATVDALSP